MELAKIVENDHGYKTTTFEYMITNAAEAVDFKNRDHLEKIDEIIKSIKDIDEKMIALANERNAMAVSLEREICDLIGCSAAYASILERAWNLARFNSIIVKKAVMKVRHLFFDELDANKSAFSKIHFHYLNVNDMYDGSGTYLKFVFAKENDISTAFAISIPVAGTCKWSWKYSYITGKYYFDKTYGGRCGSYTIMDSYKLEDIRNAVTAYVVEGKMLPKKNDPKLYRGRDKIADILLGNDKEDSFKKHVNYIYKTTHDNCYVLALHRVHLVDSIKSNAIEVVGEFIV